MSLESEEDDNLCPICAYEMDSSDLSFYPCPCNFQICAFCYNNLIHEYEPRCPSCREPYKSSSIRIIQYKPFAIVIYIIFIIVMFI